MRELIIKTEASSEPVTLAEAKDYIGYMGTDSGTEATINFLITSARLRLEHYIGRNFAEKTMVLNISKVEPKMELPYGPINAVTHVKVFDADGVEDETLTADDDYYLLGDMDKILKLESYSTGGYLNIEYTAGYGDNTYDLPGPLKTALLRQVKYDYDNRGRGDAQAIENEVAKALIPYMVDFL
jgi:uncharacterized phiE125 gp8 family phage protein